MLLEAESTLGASLPVEAVFRHPTLRELAAEIDRVVTRKGRRGWLGRLRARWAPNRVAAGAVAPVTPVQIAVPQDYDYAPVTDPALVLPRQHTYVDIWEGRRLHEGALVVGLNVNKSVAGLFWCFQGYREFSQLAGHLGAAVPVFGMRSGYLIINFEDPSHVEVLASRYADEINAIQPEGPLVLGGNCSGGRVIHAVAQKLRASGREIALLILMELRVPLPHDGKVALIFGRESHLNPYGAPGGDPDSAFGENYPSGYEVALIKGAHGQYFESPNVESLAAILTRLLTDSSVQLAKPQLQLA